MSFFKKLRKAFSRVTKLAVKTAPIWSSFIPGGSIAAKVVGGSGKLGKVGRLVSRVRQVAARHPRLVGLANKIRQARHVAPGRTGTNHPGGWARTSVMVTANPFRNGRFHSTHMRKLGNLYRLHPGSGVMYAKLGRVRRARYRHPRRARRRYA